MVPYWENKAAFPSDFSLLRIKQGLNCEVMVIGGGGGGGGACCEGIGENNSKPED